MLGSAATFEHPPQISPLLHDSKSTNQAQLRVSSILDRAIRLFNAASDPSSAISWIRFIAELETQHNLPAESPDTVVKPYRTFVVHRLSVKQRCELLRAHYIAASKALPSQTFAAFWAGSRVPLGSLRGSKGSKYHLFLAPSEHCARDGNYSFILMAGDGFELARLTFALVSGFDGDSRTQLPRELEAEIAAFVENYNHCRLHESLTNLTPADVYFGRSQQILEERQRIRMLTIHNRRFQHQRKAA